jgi:hypothetical protein
LRNALAAILLCSGCAAPGAPASRDINLLKHVDQALGAVEGEWKFDGPALVTPNVKFGRIQIWYVPPEEYDVRMVAERSSGANSIVLGLVSGGRPFMVAIDAFEHDPASGVEMIDAKSFADNETAVAGRLLEIGKRGTIVVSVRKKSIGVTVNGKKIVDWKGEPEQLSLHPKWKMPHKEALWLGAFGCVYRIHELMLVPITGEGKPLG